MIQVLTYEQIIKKYMLVYKRDEFLLQTRNYLCNIYF